MGYYLPLDTHIEYRNNASIIKALGLTPEDPIEVGYSTTLKFPVNIDVF